MKSSDPLPSQFPSDINSLYPDYDPAIDSNAPNKKFLKNQYIEDQPN